MIHKKHPIDCNALGLLIKNLLENKYNLTLNAKMENQDFHTKATMKNKPKKLLAALSIITLCSGLFLDFKDIIGVFKSKTDISGEWNFEFHTKQSTYNDYVNSTTTYRMHLIQDNNSLKGNGETWTYNGKLLPYAKHRPLEFEGTFKKGDSLLCKYILHGSKRTTMGSFRALLQKGKLIGTFTGTGANVRGKFYATQIK